MKKTLLTLFAAFAVIVGLASSVGAASAFAPTRHGGGGIQCTGSVVGDCTFVGGGALPGWLSGRITPCTITAPATTCTEPLPGWHPRGGLGLGLGLHGPLGGGLGLGLGVLPGGLLPLQQFSELGLNGNFGGGNLNVCTLPSWSVAAQFIEQQYGVQQSALDGVFGTGPDPQLVWAEIQAQAGCGSQLGFQQGFLGLNGMGLNGLTSGASYVVAGTQDVFLQGQVLDVRRMGLDGFPAVNVCQFPTWDRFAQFGAGIGGGGLFGPLQRRFGPNPAVMWANLQRQAACTQAELLQLQQQVAQQQLLVLPSSFDGISTPVAPAVQQPVPAPAPVIAPQVSTPAPSPQGTIIEVPAGPVHAGDSGLAPDAVR